MAWDYRGAYPPGFFDFIWASPPCTEYSKAKAVGVRKLEEANRVVERTLGIILYFNPFGWAMENPQTGLLKSQPFMVRTWTSASTGCPTGSGRGSGTIC